MVTRALTSVQMRMHSITHKQNHLKCIFRLGQFVVLFIDSIDLNSGQSLCLDPFQDLTSIEFEIQDHSNKCSTTNLFLTSGQTTSNTLALDPTTRFIYHADQLTHTLGFL